MKSNAMINQIFQLSQADVPIPKIVEILGVSRNTVRRYLRQAGSESRSGEGSGEAACLVWQEGVPWDTIVLERKKGVSSKTLYQEYQPAISYSQFCRILGVAVKPAIKPALKLHHTAAERVHIDFGDGIPITDQRTGRQTKTQFFAAVLPFSSYTFAVFTGNQKLDTFIRAHQKMWAFFRGVTPYVVVDNLKSGVKKAHLYDPEVNPTYCDYGNKTGFAVLPARPRTPRDKASVECGIGQFQVSFFEAVRNETFYSLDELNARLSVYLKEFNHRIMKDYGISRWERFETERRELLPLPQEEYQICEWREAKVHPDCCVNVLKNYYSVPFQHLGQSVRVKISSQLIEIFDHDTKPLACHKRLFQPHTYSIEDAHLPPRRMQMASFQVEKAMRMASLVGPKTLEMVKEQLSGQRPLRYLRRVQGISVSCDCQGQIQCGRASEERVLCSSIQPINLLTPRQDP